MRPFVSRVWLAGRVLIAAYCACATVQPADAASGIVRVIAVTGDPAPDGNGTFDVIGSPHINGAGQVAFWGQLAGSMGGTSDRLGIFRGDGTALVQMVRGGEAQPTVPLSPSTHFVLSNAGDVAIESNTNSSTNGAIFRSDGVHLTTIAASDQPSPQGGLYGHFGWPSINNLGHVAFGTMLGEYVGQTWQDTDGAIVRSDGLSSVPIGWVGQPAPDGNGAISGFFLPLDSGPPLPFNNAGQVAFRAQLSDAMGGATSGVFVGDGANLVQIARTGQAAPEGIGVISDLFARELNEGGQTAVYACFANCTYPYEDRDAGIYVGEGTTLTPIARTGQPLPGWTGGGEASVVELRPTRTAFTKPALNNSGQVVLRAELNVSGVVGEFIIRSNGTAAVPIAMNVFGRGGGPFSEFREPLLNDAGQVAFAAVYDRNQVVMLFDDSLGLLTVASQGDALLGSTVTSLSFIGNEYGGEITGLSNSPLPQVAYWFQLADGRSGVAVWTLVPEPSGLALLTIAGIAFGHFARRRRV